ncbi:hypothetical protein ACCO45_013385 [Purpureocillium lilacinum]|uniref:Uncharacterized protein n=1 Tax=Purpureocillium lilacinum TaxID=33203 RepID=A0ACC4D8U5_PURLI
MSPAKVLRVPHAGGALGRESFRASASPPSGQVGVTGGRAADRRASGNTSTKVSKQRQDSQGHSITVFRGSPPTNAYAWSPFVTKLEARLRFDGLRYTLGGGSPPSAPKGKIAYVEIHHGDSKEILGDTALIIRALISNGDLRDVNATLAPVQWAHDLAVRSMMEDRVYFYGVREKMVR